MKSNQLLADLTFHESDPFAQPLLVDQYSRILRWTLKPGQKVENHSVPGSPFYVIVLKGRGMFSASGTVEAEYGPASLLIFEPDELHSVRALDEELVFVGFLRGVETMRAERTGGELGRE